MAINSDNAFDIGPNGLVFRDEDGLVTGYLVSGSGSPVGVAAPLNTWYFRTDDNSLWYKYDAHVDAWRQIRADDVTFDPTGLMNFLSTDNDVYKALARFGNFSVADLTEAEGDTQNASDSTTSNGWVSRSGFPFLTTDVKTAGQFSIRWSTEIGQSTKNRNYGLLIRWRVEGGTWETLSSVELSNARNNNYLMQGGFKEVTVATDTKIEVDMQFGQTTGGGTALIQNSALEVRRISD